MVYHLTDNVLEELNLEFQSMCKRFFGTKIMFYRQNQLTHSKKQYSCMRYGAEIYIEQIKKNNAH